MFFEGMIFNQTPAGEVKYSAATGALALFVAAGDIHVAGRLEHLFYRLDERSSGLLLGMMHPVCLRGKNAFIRTA